METRTILLHLLVTRFPLTQIHNLSLIALPILTEMPRESADLFRVHDFVQVV